MQDLPELMGYQDITDQTGSLVPRAQKAKKEQMEKEEKWVFGQLSHYFPCCLSLSCVLKGLKCVQGLRRVASLQARRAQLFLQVAVFGGPRAFFLVLTMV